MSLEIHSHFRFINLFEYFRGESYTDYVYIGLRVE
jgi:hypothetical protein